MPTAREISTAQRLQFDRRMVGFLVALLAGALSACSSPLPIDLTGSSLLLITVDTLRTDHVGAFGDAGSATPVIDRLAREGIAFPNAYAHVPLTLPSHSALFTGRYPFALQVRNNGSYYLRPQETTLAERLAENGYSTAAFVASYVLASKFGLDQGFDLYDDTIETGDLIQNFTSEVPADTVVDRFERWLQRDRPERFFAWLHFYDPHLPYEPPEPFRQRFPNDAYRGEVAFVDQQVGRALAALESVDRRDETLVVLTSDHGEAFGEHGEVGHGILTYDETLRVPLVLSAGNRLPKEAVIEERVRLVDLYPTLIDLLGIPTPERLSSDASTDIPGRSLVPLLQGATESRPRRVYFESLLGPEDYNWAPITGLISGNHKYISVPRPELYDLVRDPGERTNLYRSHPALAEEIDHELRQLLLEADDSTPAPRRELTAEDTDHLRALGYLGAAESAETSVDPKTGILIDRRIKDIRSLANAGDLKRAQEEAEALADRHSDLAMAGLYALRHEIAVRLGDQDASIGVLRQGLEALPGSDRLRLLLANALLEANQIEEAVAVSEQILQGSPRFSQAIIVLGRSAEAGGDFHAAVARYDEALELEPRSLPLRRRRAEALLRAGQVEEALSELAALAEAGAFGEDPERIYQIAVLSSQLGNQQRAERLFRLGLQEAPGGVHHVTFALLLLERGKPGEAKEHLEIALQQYPRDLDPRQRSVAEATLARLVTPSAE